MRNMNCRNVRREIEEVAPGKWLSSDVNNHVLSCVACETLLREQTKLRELVSSLGTVEAPGDFDYRLRARLAAEKRRLAQPFSFRNFSFGLRSAAVATIVLLIGSALIVSFRTRSTTPLTTDASATAPERKESNPAVAKGTVATNGPETGRAPQTNEGSVVDGSVKSTKAPVNPPTKRRGLSGIELAAQRESNRQRSRDSSSTRAAVLKRDQLAGVYPTSAFPIDGGYQSLRVSVDDGRGTSRTISLPTVSFGSQRSLSQSSSPLMASVRGAW